MQDGQSQGFLPVIWRRATDPARPRRHPRRSPDPLIPEAPGILEVLVRSARVGLVAEGERAIL